MRKRALKPMILYLTAPVLVMPIVALLRARITNLGQARVVVETKSAFEPRDTLAFRFVGRVPSRSPAPQRAVDGHLTRPPVRMPAGRAGPKCRGATMARSSPTSFPSTTSS